MPYLCDYDRSRDSIRCEVTLLDEPFHESKPEGKLENQSA
jgi:hypothetical protein